MMMKMKMEAKELAIAGELGVTLEVFRYMLLREHTCVFVSTTQLLACMGNKLQPSKLMRGDEPLHSIPLPVLVMNPDCGQIVLVEGNHRLHAAHCADRQWFPVALSVIYGAAYGARGRFISTMQCDEELHGFRAADDPKKALREMYGLDVL
jgi:hypothetical protein